MTTVSFAHLLALSDSVGTFEHARFRTPRREHGYCVDDVSRTLIVVCSESDRGSELADLEQNSLRFVLDAQDRRGRTRNRRDVSGRWTSPPVTDDCWGRSLWALGFAAARVSDPVLERFALSTYDVCCGQTSTSPRALAFATLGAEQIHRHPLSSPRWVLPVHRFVEWLDAAPWSVRWPWPEERLAYANAVLCHAAIAAGMVLDRIDLVRRGLDLLDWLVEHDTIDGHLSPVPVGGAGPGDRPGRFDQQPIEIASLARAATRAFEATYDRSWIDVVELCARWFDGDNDAGLVMWDHRTGAGFDGLHADGVNENCGAESTLAAMATMQQRTLLAAMVS